LGIKDHPFGGGIFFKGLKVAAFGAFAAAYTGVLVELGDVLDLGVKALGAQGLGRAEFVAAAGFAVTHMA
jgi:hypothetical protein